MSWFKFYKTESSTIFSYPYNRRVINRIKPKDNLAQGTWIFADITDLNIDSKLSSNLESQSDSLSYLVVYQNLRSEDYFVPVKTIIIDNLIYFQTAEDHIAEQFSNYNYVIYYNTPNIRKIKSDTINNEEVFVVSDDIQNSSWYATENDIDTASFSVDLNSNTYYNFSFVGQSWSNGESKLAGATAYATFTGPIFKLKAKRGPNFGKLKYQIMPIALDADDLSTYSELTQDLYSELPSDEQIIIDRSDLSYKDYRLKITVDSTKNILSSDNLVNVTEYEFSYNVYANVGPEQYYPEIAFITIGGVS